MADKRFLRAGFGFSPADIDAAAAMPSMMETCTKKLGVDEKLTNFALPF